MQSFLRSTNRAGAWINQVLGGLISTVNRGTMSIGHQRASLAHTLRDSPPRVQCNLHHGGRPHVVDLYRDTSLE
eukprot:jgi/Botrbrau1/13150/Bobra.0187s0098.1